MKTLSIKLLILVAFGLIFFSCGENDQMALQKKKKNLELIENNMKYLYSRISTEEMELIKWEARSASRQDSISIATAKKQRLIVDSIRAELRILNNKADSLRADVALLNKKLIEKGS